MFNIGIEGRGQNHRESKGKWRTNSPYKSISIYLLFIYIFVFPVELLIGKERAAEVEQATLKIFQRAQAYASERGILLADTKLEFGIDSENRLILADEVLTPDSSRFWNRETYKEGQPQERYIVFLCQIRRIIISPTYTCSCLYLSNIS
jgi:hypothetical protein